MAGEQRANPPAPQLCALVLAAGYVVRAQATQPSKSEILLNFEFTRNGTVIAAPVLRMADGVTTTLRLQDGTEVTSTAWAKV